jgi:hypothetical protein
MGYEVNLKFSMYHENLQARCIVLDFQIENVHMYVRMYMCAYTFIKVDSN